MATEKTQTLSNLRTKILSESLRNEGRNRFGLFSYPPAGVAGDGDYLFNKSKRLGTDGKPVTQPRGLYSGPGRSGKSESSYFSRAAYVTIGDKYIDPASMDRQYQNAKKQKNTHDAEWKPADGTKSDPFSSVFKHMDDHREVKKNYRGPDGKVMTAPRNITANPPKEGHGNSTVGHLLNKTSKHMADPYERKREMEAKERIENKKKLQEQPFRSVSHGGDNFATVKQTFGKDGKVLAYAPPKPLKEASKTHHEQPFKPSNPSKQGYNKTINKFPQYKEDPIRQAVRQFEDPSKKREAFRPNNTAFNERPTPSVSLNKLNLKNEMIRVSNTAGLI